MRVNFVLSEVATGLRRNLTMTVAMILTTAISLGLMGTGLLIAGMISDMKEIYYDKVQVSIFLADDVTDEQRAAIETRAGGLARGQELHLRVQGRGLRALPAAVQPAARAGAEHPGRRAAGELPRRAGQPRALPGHRRGVPQRAERRRPGARRGRLPRPPVQPAQRRPQRDDRRGGGPGAGGAAADLEHDPAGRVQPAQRDEHHAAGRRLPLVHPAAVHPRGRARRADRCAAGRRRAGPDQGALRRPHAGRADQGRHHPAGRLGRRSPSSARSSPRPAWAWPASPRT